MKIHFLRHGRTDANERGLYYGATDLPLSEKGLKELVELKETIDYPIAETYLASGLRRARQSLNILYGREPERMIAEFNEFDFGDFEMKSHDELKENPEYLRWIDGTAETCPGGESMNRFTERILKGFEMLRALESRSIVLVCHGGVIATLMDQLFPQQREHYYAWIPDCGRGYTVEMSGGQPDACFPIE